MADPASVLGLIAASLTITIRAAAIGKDIHTLVSKYKSTNRKVTQLSIHVAAVRVAARSLSSWLEDEQVGSEDVEDVKRELLEVLTACCGLLLDLQEHISKALSNSDDVRLKGAIHYIWDEDIIKETTETLHHQETVLILMLQALERLSQKEQQAKLREEVVLQALIKAKRPSSSIFGVKSEPRSSARFSYVSEIEGRDDEVFVFDVDVINSTAYRNAYIPPHRLELPEPKVKFDEMADAEKLAYMANLYPDININTGRVPYPEARRLQKALNGIDREAEFLSMPRPDSPTMQITPLANNFEVHPTPEVGLPPLPRSNGLSPETGVTREDPPGPCLDDSVSHWQHQRGWIRDSPKIPNVKTSPDDAASKYVAKTPALPVVTEDVTSETAMKMPTRLPCVRAMWDYEADSRHKLSFQAGDIIQVVSILESGWWDGVLGDVRGWFPSNYCRFLEVDDIPALLSQNAENDLREFMAVV